MDLKPSMQMPYLRSCLEETLRDIEGEVQGEIPTWLKGNLIRIGSGLLELGPDRCEHVFDGLALMHKFSFQDGKVTYLNKFLKSDVYKSCKKANRFVTMQFGTRGVPDPCKTIFQRLSSIFQADVGTDNDLVNVVRYGNEYYTSTEGNYIRKINPDTLETLEKVNLSIYNPIQMALAHPHEHPDGTVYNMGSQFGFTSTYNIMKFPSNGKSTESPFENSSIVCQIPTSRRFRPSYYHSFAMTENYFIFVEQPLCMFLPYVLWIFFVSGSFADAMKWDDKEPCRFHVVRRSDGKLIDTRYVSKSFFVFHHINAYEEDDHLVVDMCTYDDAEVMKALYLKALEEFVSNPLNPESPLLASRAKRFVLPLKLDTMKRGDQNLVIIPNSKATAYRQADGSIYLNSELLTKPEETWAPELPRINYENYNGRKYKYFYALAKNSSETETQLIKVDTVSKETIRWYETGAVPSEPVFISEPLSENKQEDSGVLVASLLYTDDEKKVSLLVLDARTMQEIGRVTFHTESSIPADFHGAFIARR